MISESKKAEHDSKGFPQRSMEMVSKGINKEVYQTITRWVKWGSTKEIGL